MKENKGITIVALVITIVIMLILLGVTVTVVIKGDLIDTAKESNDETRYAQVLEQKEMWESEKLATDRFGAKAETLEEFVEKIKNDDDFAKKHGNLGPVYGAQWRNFNNEGTDQLMKLIDSLKNNPFSRRHIISAWNPSQVDEMALPPCHTLMQFYVSSDKKYLSCQLYQRSADTFLGVPFNIASYALLTCMLAQVCGYEPKEFIHTIGDAHIYKNHFDVVKTQIEREPLPLPRLVLNKDIDNLFDFKIEDIKLEGYQSHGPLKGKVSV